MKPVTLTGQQWALVHNMLAHHGPKIQDEYLRHEYHRIARDMENQVWK